MSVILFANNVSDAFWVALIFGFLVGLWKEMETINPFPFFEILRDSFAELFKRRK